VVGESGRAAVEATVLVDSASALALLGQHAAAARAVARGATGTGPGATERCRDAGCRLAAPVARGQAAQSRTQTGIVLATIHVQAGEQRELQLAHGAITDVTKLTSVGARRQLLALPEALQARGMWRSELIARY
jgi:hypothetical protein